MSDDFYELDFDAIDFRASPELYRVGRGEQGVFKVEPYKSELLPLWSFKDPDAAQESVEAIMQKYAQYKANDEFVGMDMARKYLQMGWTRARRYAKYPGGKKYDDDGTERAPQQPEDAEKAQAAAIFKQALETVKDDEMYQQMKAAHQERTET